MFFYFLGIRKKVRLGTIFCSICLQYWCQLPFVFNRIKLLLSAYYLKQQNKTTMISVSASQRLVAPVNCSNNTYSHISPKWQSKITSCVKLQRKLSSCHKKQEIFFKFLRTFNPLANVCRLGQFFALETKFSKIQTSKKWLLSLQL